MTRQGFKGITIRQEVYEKIGRIKERLGKDFLAEAVSEIVKFYLEHNGS